MKKLILSIDGRDVEVLAQKAKGKVWFHWQGDTYEYTPRAAQKASGSGQAALDPTQIVAPMPGKIIKLQKQEGDSVKEGETVVVMEAMKMEYNLKASKEMSIKKILVSENQTVSLAERLVELEEL